MGSLSSADILNVFTKTAGEALASAEDLLGDTLDDAVTVMKDQLLSGAGLGEIISSLPDNVIDAANELVE